MVAIVEFINDYRANFESKYYSASAYKTLEENDELTELAETRAHEMAEENVLTHTRPDGTKGWDAINMGEIRNNQNYRGEICSAGWNEHDSVANTMSGFMKSTLHHAQIVKTYYKYIGVGICNGFCCINFAGEAFQGIDD